MSDVQVELLKQFVKICRADPAFLHSPKMAFYKEYLESMGAKIPSAPEKPEPTTEKPSNESGPKPSFEKQQSEEEEPEIPPPDIDESGVTPPDNDEPLPMGDTTKEVTDEDLEKANENRDMGAAAFSEGNFQKALQHFTAAIVFNPGLAILHAKRANVLLKLSKPVAAIRDCEKAIAINPDSAQGYKFRGRAYRLLGKWTEAHKDLATACKLDYDDVAYEWMKEVEPNAKKIHDYERAKERRVEERELRERRERVERAREANKRAAEDASAHNAEFEGAEGAGGFGMGGFSELFKELADDPELLQMLKDDPSLIQKITDIMGNPANIMKHMNDPGVQKLLGKLGSRFGAGGGFPGGPPTEAELSTDSCPFGAGEPETAPKKAPEPDLD